MNPFGDFNALDQFKKDKIKRLAEKHLSEELLKINELIKELNERMAKAKASEVILSLLNQ